jgi:hypothetical protein
MQGNVALLTMSFIAAGTLAQFQPVQATGVAAVAAGNAVGSANVSAVSGDLFPAVVLGTALFVAGGAIAVGALVEVHTTVTQVITKAAGIAIGRALNATSAAGDFVEVLLIPN